MDPLNAFLTNLIKGFLKHGFLETIERNMEFIIKAAFKGLAELTIMYLKEMIKKTYSFFEDFSFRTENNSIFHIIIKIIKGLSLPDFETIKLYLSAAVNLLKKLSQKFSEFKEWAFGKKTELRTSKLDISKAVMVPSSREETEPNISEGDMIPSSPLLALEYSSREETEPNISEGDMIPSRFCPLNVCPINRGDIEETMSISRIETMTITRTVQFVRNETMRCMVGTRRVTNSNFKGVEKKEKKISYYVGRVILDASEDDIRDHLMEIIPGGTFEINKLKSNGKIQSFKITANLSSKKALEDPNNWPKDVTVRRWVRKDKLPQRLQLNGPVITNAIEAN